MTDREQVIKNAIDWLDGEIRRADYFDLNFLDCVEVRPLRELHDLLISQQPRVMTLEEVVKHEWDFVYVEKERRAYSKEVEAFCGKYRVHCTTSVALERQIFGDSEYNKTWRCWSACPTDEQRKAVKWE